MEEFDMSRYCDNIECTYCEYDNCILDANVPIDTDYCRNFISVLTTPEYQEEYWICVKDKKKTYNERVLKHGIKIELYGLVFFSSENIKSEDYRLTEKQTGRIVYKQELDNNSEKIKELISRYEDVMTLPIREEETK